MTRRSRRLALALLLPALLLRALLPAGFMPTAHSGGGIALELCTSEGMRTVIVDLDSDPAPAAPEPHRESPCAYASAASSAPPPAPTVFTPFFAGASAPGSAACIEAPARPVERAQSARAPPLSA